MAAMILLGAVLFVTITSSPVQETGAAGISLSTLAGDTLNVLEKQQGRDDPSATRLEEVVNLAMRGEVEAAERFLDAAVPQGTRYALRLDNGVEPLQLIPAAGSLGSTPRAASGAVTYMLGNWTDLGSEPDCEPVSEQSECFPPASSTALDGNGTIDFSNATELRAPNDSTVGPGAVPWIDIWKAAEPTGDTVPAFAPYGVWRCTGCTDIAGSHFRVVLEDGTAVDRPLYGVQLLLWDGV